jgi:hypothetical protein
VTPAFGRSSGLTEFRQYLDDIRQPAMGGYSSGRCPAPFRLT